MPLQRQRAALALAFVTAAALSGCGGGGDSPTNTSRGAPTYSLSGTVTGLDEGSVDIVNGADRITVAAGTDAQGTARNLPFSFQLPANAQYQLLIDNDTLGQYGLQCSITGGGPQLMPAGPQGGVLVNCARVKSLRLLAGQAPLPAGRDGLASQVRFARLSEVAVDSASGNVFVADLHAIRRISPDGVVTTIAGSVTEGGSADGSGDAARLQAVGGLAAGGGGTLYVSDLVSHTVRRIAPAGTGHTVSTLAGQAEVPGAADGAGAAARFNQPSDITVDATGTLHVSDRGNNAIRRITPGGVVSTLPVTPDARLNSIASGPNGLLYASGGQTVHRIDSTGTLASYNGSAWLAGWQQAANLVLPADLAVDPQGTLYVADGGAIRRIAPSGASSNVGWMAAGAAAGTPTRTQFDDFIRGLTADASGNLYATVAETVQRISPSGVLTRLAGVPPDSRSIDGSGTAAQFKDVPTSAVLDAQGNLYVIDANAIRRVTPAGRVTTIAGSALETGSADGPGTAARFDQPITLAVNAPGTLYVVDSHGQVLRRVQKRADSDVFDVDTVAGVPSTTALPAPVDGERDVARFMNVRGLAADAQGNLFVSDGAMVRRVTPSGRVDPVAGLPGQVGAVDGIGSAARFGLRNSLAVDAAGRLYMTDTTHHLIRRIGTDGAVTTLAGSTTDTATPFKDGPGAAARFNLPSAIAVDSAGVLYVTDLGNHAIRVLTPRADGGFDVTTSAGGAARDDLLEPGPLPRAIGRPMSVAATGKRIYFTNDSVRGVLFIDR